MKSEYKLTNTGAEVRRRALGPKCGQVLGANVMINSDLQLLIIVCIF